VGYGRNRGGSLDVPSFELKSVVRIGEDWFESTANAYVIASYMAKLVGK